MTSEADVLHQMIDAGLPELPDRLEASGKLRRFGRRKRGWYRLFVNVARSGRSYLTGSFGYWGLVDGTRVRPAVDLDEIDRAAMLARLRDLQAAEERKRRDAAARAAMVAVDRWRAASKTGESLYLRRKCVLAEAVRFEPDGTVLVPMLRYDLPREQALVGLQAIRADGEKRFIAGTAKRGSACRLGSPVLTVDAPVLVCEGLATGLTLRQACGQRWPVYVAFDAGNLLPVARTLRRLYPRAWLLFCADDDFLTWSNPGRSKAAQAARIVGNADFIAPVIAGRGERKLTDFNDLHVEHGLEEVSRQLDMAIRTAVIYARRRIAA